MSGAATDSDSRKFRVLTAELEHETNTFCVIPTTLDNFKKYQYIDNAHDIEVQRRGTKSSLGAGFEAADKYGWTLTPTICAVANPTGKVTSDAFETICDIMLAPLKAQPQEFNGILLFLHGAMVTGKVVSN
jgi:microcystin degradation protein MlrC